VLGVAPYVMNAPYREAFLPALRGALHRGVRVEVLVLDPQSRAADQCALDLDGTVDVTATVSEVLRAFRTFATTLEPAEQEHLDVRVYSALPPARMYRWDDRAISSLFPTGNWAGSDIEHYETTATTGLGRLVDEQFSALRDDDGTCTLDAYFTVGLTCPERVDAPPVTSGYVRVDGRYYVADTDPPSEVWLPDLDDLLVRISARDGAFHAVRVDPEHPAMSGLAAAFRRKYGAESGLGGRPRVMVRLDPVPPAEMAAGRGTSGARGRRLSLLPGDLGSPQGSRPPEAPGSAHRIAR